MRIAYLLKYALTTGVVAVDVSGFDDSSQDGYLYGRWFSGGINQSYKEGRDFTYSLDEAKEMFDKMRERKVDSLIKQQKKLHQMHFKIKE